MKNLFIILFFISGTAFSQVSRSFDEEFGHMVLPSIEPEDFVMMLSYKAFAEKIGKNVDWKLLKEYTTPDGSKAKLYESKANDLIVRFFSGDDVTVKFLSGTHKDMLEFIYYFTYHNWKCQAVFKESSAEKLNIGEERGFSFTKGNLEVTVIYHTAIDICTVTISD